MSNTQKPQTNAVASLDDLSAELSIATFSDVNELSLLLRSWQDPKTADFVRLMTEKKIKALQSKDQNLLEELLKEEEGFLASLG